MVKRESGIIGSLLPPNSESAATEGCEGKRREGEEEEEARVGKERWRHPHPLTAEGEESELMG